MYRRPKLVSVVTSSSELAPKLLDTNISYLRHICRGNSKVSKAREGAHHKVVWTANGLGVVRYKFTSPWLSCVRCLQQHRKCDEARPKCGRCSRLNINCDFKQNIRWVNGPNRLRRERQDKSLSRESRSRGASSPVLSKRLPREDELPLYFEMPSSGNASHEAATSTPHSGEPRNCDAVTQHDISILDGQDLALSKQDLSDEDSHSSQTSSTEKGSDCIAEIGSSSELHAQNHAFYGDIFSFLFPSTEESVAYAYFIRSVAMIIPACDSTQNGYRQLAILALSTPVLMGTIISISTLYMHLRGGATMSLALQRQSRALAALRDSLCSLTSSNTLVYCESLKRDILATILLQITVEMANGGSGSRTHITYAWNLFRELGYERQKPTCSIGTVLVQRMTWIDTISSLFWQQRPFLPLSFWFFESNKRASPTTSCDDEDSQPTFQETTGCPRWVITFLARISHLCADNSDGLPHSLIIPQAHVLEADLNISARHYFNHATPIQTHETRRHHLEIVGQCFYWSAVLLLQRRIFHDRRDSRRVQSTLVLLIELIELLPIGCGPDSALSLPLYLAAHEAIEPEHRARIRQKSRRLMAEYPSKTREALAQVHEAIWADMDRFADVEGEMVGRPGSPDYLVRERCLFIC
ncbi:hypothetical protein AJ79_10013 [Helicocarpus griseus UAMH5409]|uniref:Zn(2)-C6 fungal-type domain-containing protein n=1 Tax=Helicocarpus griseus UAMH5409 TaxID=1447875 RepID=A0A2B7WFZ4_9EURO|nr:hypothetical protein AJ79_10013 [Helicocarpus griseus UAMH5409]